MNIIIKTAMLLFVTAIMLTGCIEDGITDDVTATPLISSDTLYMGRIFTGELSPTAEFRIYNPNSKGIVIDSVTVRGGNGGVMNFNLLVNGGEGDYAHNVEIRAKDSISVYLNVSPVENNFDEPIERNSVIDIHSNNSIRSIVVNAITQDVTRLKGETVLTDTEWSTLKPFVVFDSLTVAKGASLTLAAGTRLFFHNGAKLVVEGNISAYGTPENPVIMEGDRQGFVVGHIPYEIMSGQWDGVYVTGRMFMSHTVIRNNKSGVTIDAEGETAKFVNCRLSNAENSVLTVLGGNVEAVGCEFSEAAAGTVSLMTGRHIFNHCTFANNYLFAPIVGPLLSVADDAAVDASNSIFYSIAGGSLGLEDKSAENVLFRNCLFKEKGEDDESFISTIWDADPLFQTVRDEYFFDYRLKENSVAIGSADASLTHPDADRDFYGEWRGTTPDMGAYVYRAM